MLPSNFARQTPPSLRSICFAAALLATVAGCKTTPAVTDSSLASAIQSQIAADGAVGGQPIQTSVQAGVATLSGTVQNDAQRTIAARDAAGVAGIREVVNNISVLAPGAVVATAPTPQPIPVQTAALPAPVSPGANDRQQRLLEQRQQAEQARQQREQDRLARKQQQQQQASRLPAPVERRQDPTYQQQQQQAPPPPPQPSFRNLIVASGSAISVRVTQTLDSATTQPGDSFSGVVASDVLVDGAVAIPAGSSVSGRVDDVHEAAHFKGSSLLTVSLIGVTRRGERLSVSSEPYSVQGKGRGTNTAEKTGGGAAVGAILGGIFGGGKGAAIGAGAGAGVGAGSNAITRGQQVQIPSESVIRFRLTAPVSVRVRSDGEGNNNGELQRR